MPLYSKKTRKNQNKLVHEGFHYLKQKHTKLGVAWRCVKYHSDIQCPAVIRSSSDENTGYIIGEVPCHNHGVEPLDMGSSPVLPTINRPTTSTSATTAEAAVNRPALIANAVPPERPIVRSPDEPPTPASTTSTKVLPIEVNVADCRTKYETVYEELTALKEKHKEAISRHDELQRIIVEFQHNEDANIAKITTLESDNTALKEEIRERGKSLEEYKKLCEEQEKILSEHAENVQKIESTVESQTSKINSDESDKDRRVLHNTIKEMKGTIRVFCRVRPRIPKELGKNQCAIDYIDESTLEIGRADGSDSLSCSGNVRGVKQKFSFDKVFPSTASQSDIFKELALLVQSALEGFNVCVFAYGQAGSGKTYTMVEEKEAEYEGIIPRTVRHIFLQMNEFELLGWEYKIEASFLEIYNENIVDLLDCNKKNHEIRMVDQKGTDLYVTDLKVEDIHSPEEFRKCLRIAQKNRAIAATKSNERSSRSHLVARIRLTGTHKEKGEMSIGNLNLVDLAGSQTLNGEEAVRHTETKNINKSLANLGNVILALLKKQDHIPYRNSKLTHLLMPSLGGNSKTVMLLNVSPLDECYNETLNSLRFASNVNSCKLGKVRRVKTVLQKSNNGS